MPYIGTISHQRKQYAEGMLYRSSIGKSMVVAAVIAPGSGDYTSS
jgi:hypothetical protein